MMTRRRRGRPRPRPFVWRNFFLPRRHDVEEEEPRSPWSLPGSSTERRHDNEEEARSPSSLPVRGSPFFSSPFFSP